jgi:hypothetical protein
MPLMAWIALLVALLFTLLGALCVLGVVVQLPGTWVLLGLALLVEATDGLYLPEGERRTFDLVVLLVALALAGLGELVEFLSGALGVAKGGGTRRGLWGALIGGLAGLVAFTPLFAFVPFFGAFLGVLLGTFAGALLGELTHERATLRSAWRPALWSALGRLAGTTGKFALALVIWMLLTVSAFWR